MSAERKEVPVIDLKERFGDHYRLEKDPAHNPRKFDPMYWIIPCKHAEIYPFGHDNLAVMVTSIRIANEMRSWPELRVHQDADDAVVFVFDVKHFQKVADRVGARKKKRLSPEHLAKLKSAGTVALEKRVSQTVEGPKSLQNRRTGVEE